MVVKLDASAFFGTAACFDAHGRGGGYRADHRISTAGRVRATALDALQDDFAPFVNSEACGDRDLRPHDASLFDLQAKLAEVVDLARALTLIEGASK